MCATRIFSPFGASVTAALIGVGCAKAPPPKAPIEEAPLELGPVSSTTTSASSSTVPEQLGGVTLSSPAKSLKAVRDPHPADTFIPGRNISWLAPKKIQDVESVRPDSTHYGIVSGKLVAIVMFFKGDAACSTLRAALPSHYGSPTSKTEPTGFSYLSWKSGSTALDFGGNFSSQRPEDHDCSLSLQADQSSVQTAQDNDSGPAMGHNVDHFGTAKLGAAMSSFQGLTMKEKTTEGDYCEPPVKKYHGIPLSRLWYKFQHDLLVTVGFDADKFAECPKLLSTLKAEYGPGEQHGDSYEWEGPGGIKLTYTTSDIMKGCGGYLGAPVSQSSSTPSFPSGDSPFTTSGTGNPTSRDPFETTTPGLPRVVQ